MKKKYSQTIVLRLPPDLKSKLLKDARNKGITLSKFLRKKLSAKIYF